MMVNVNINILYNIAIVCSLLNINQIMLNVNINILYIIVIVCSLLNGRTVDEGSEEVKENFTREIVRQLFEFPPTTRNLKPAENKGKP